MSQSNRFTIKARENHFFSDKTAHKNCLKAALEDKESPTAISSILLQGDNFIPLEEKKNAMAGLGGNHHLVEEVDFNDENCAFSLIRKKPVPESDQKYSQTNSCFNSSTNASISLLSSNNSSFSHRGYTNSSRLILNFLNISDLSLRNEAIILALTAYVEKNDLKNFDFYFNQIDTLHLNIINLQKWMEIAIASDADKIIEYLHKSINENLFSFVPDEASADFVTEKTNFLELAIALNKYAAIKKLKELSYTNTTIMDSSLSSSTFSISTISTMSALFTLPKLTQDEQNKNKIITATKEEPKMSCCLIT